MVESIELPNLENAKLLKFLIDEGVDRTDADEMNKLENLEASKDSLAFFSGDKARVFITRSYVRDSNVISVFSAEQLTKCIKVLGNGSKIKFSRDKEFPVLICDEDSKNVIALAPIMKQEDE